jgi:hypothetical protein
MDLLRVPDVVYTLEIPVVALTASAVDVPVCVPNVGGTKAVIEPEAREVAELIPDPDCFTTVKVYAVPVANPVTVMGELAPLAVNELGDEVTT